MARPPLRTIEAGQAQLSSTHLQGPEENNAAALVAEFFPEQQALRHIGATADHRLVEIEPGQPLRLVNTEVTRITPDTVSLVRATSTTYDPGAGTVEGPAQLSAEQMTPRARSFLLPPLELSHADYLRRAGGSEDCLSEEHWERAIEQLQNGHGAQDIAQILNVDARQVTIVHMQLIETHLESIAAAPPARSASPSIDDAGITTPGGTFVSEAALDLVRGLQAQNPATRNADGTPTPFGAAIGKRGTSAKDPTSGLNHVGRALGQPMVEAKRPQREIARALGISRDAATALKREVEERAGADPGEQSRVSQAGSSEMGTAQHRGFPSRPRDRDRGGRSGR